ncbi:MAG: ATP-binding cassette domain-containing protein [Thermoplasmatota archaeon]
MIAIEGLTKRRGSFVLGPLDMNIAKGETVVVRGPNGAGKTTLLYLLAGFLRPDEGRILLEGRPITSSPPEARAFAMVFSEPTLFPSMTVEENLGFQPRIAKPDPRRLADLIDMLSLRTILPKRPRELSLGESRRVELARALLSKPRLLLLDEVYAAFPNVERDSLARSIQDMVGQGGGAVLEVSHDQGHGARATRVVELARSSVTPDGPRLA